MSNQIVKKVAFEQGISEEEAMELVQMLLSQDFTEELTEEAPVEETYEEIEMDAINKDFDTQMANDSEGQVGLDTAQNDLTMAVAKLRTARKNRKVALDDLDPQRKEELNNAAVEVINEEPGAINQEELSPALFESGDMYQQLANTSDPEIAKEIIKFNLGIDPRVAKKFASYADPRFGVPESEGKIYRSWVNPRYFKSAKGNLYKMSVVDPYAEGGEEQPVEPAPAPPVAPTPPAEGESPSADDPQYNLDEQAKQHLNQIMADAEANGTSSHRLLGIFFGFVGDKKILSLGSSQEEMAEIQEGFRLGQQARGGQTTAKKVKSAGGFGGPGAGSPNYPSSGNAPAAPSQQQGINPNQQHNRGDVSTLLDQIAALMNDPSLDDGTKWQQIVAIVNGGGV